MWRHALSHDIMCSLHKVGHLRRARHESYDGYVASYDALRANDPKSESNMVKHLHESQQHTATSHMNSSLTLDANFFHTTPASETYTNQVNCIWR
jgi:hypothetical protein